MRQLQRRGGRATRLAAAAAATATAVCLTACGSPAGGAGRAVGASPPPSTVPATGPTSAGTGTLAPLPPLTGTTLVAPTSGRGTRVFTPVSGGSPFTVALACTSGATVDIVRAPDVDSTLTCTGAAVLVQFPRTAAQPAPLELRGPDSAAWTLAAASA